MNVGLAYRQTRAQFTWFRLIADDFYVLEDEGSVQFGLEWLRVKEVDAKAYTNFNLAQIVNRQFPVAYYGNFDNFTVVETATRRDTASAYAQWLQELGFDTRLTLGCATTIMKTLAITPVRAWGWYIS